MSQPSSSSFFVTSSNPTSTTLISNLNLIPVYRPSVTPILWHRAPLHLAAFNVRTLLQVDQQSCLACPLETLHVGICWVSETRIQDPTLLTYLRSPRSFAGSEFTLRVSSDPASNSRGYAGVALSTRAGKELVKWILINTRPCAAHLGSSIRVNKQRNAKWYLFIVSAYAPTACSNDETEDFFYRDFSNLLQSTEQCDVFVLAGGMSAQVGRITSSEKHLGGPFGIQTNQMDNGDRVLQLCAHHKLCLISTNIKR